MHLQHLSVFLFLELVPHFLNGCAAQWTTANDDKSRDLFRLEFQFGAGEVNGGFDLRKGFLNIRPLQFREIQFLIAASAEHKIATFLRRIFGNHAAVHLYPTKGFGGFFRKLDAEFSPVFLARKQVVEALFGCAKGGAEFFAAHGDLSLRVDI
ncbi:MAG: hypothetical protein ACKVUS_18545 [Saprospiraceae bacterium]